jgi:hypothetical protein
VNSAPKFDPLAPVKDCRKTRCAGRRLLFPALALLVFLGLLGGSAAAAPGPGVRTAPVTSVGPGPSFAIADFDGDHRPDLANVQTGRADSSFTDYRIQLQLTAAGRQFLQVFAPTGGLQIAARDVNGDQAVDLVLTTAWLKQPVAVFLNDGHGGFSRVEPAAFPGAFSDSTANLARAPDAAADVVALPPQSPSGINAEARYLSDFRLHTDLIPASRSGFVFGSFPISHAGRAPPSEVLCR